MLTIENRLSCVWKLKRQHLLWYTLCGQDLSINWFYFFEPVPVPWFFSTWTVLSIYLIHHVAFHSVVSMRIGAYQLARSFLFTLKSAGPCFHVSLVDLRSRESSYLFKVRSSLLKSFAQSQEKLSLYGPANLSFASLILYNLYSFCLPTYIY